jgi:hypothetical protein
MTQHPPPLPPPTQSHTPYIYFLTGGDGWVLNCRKCCWTRFGVKFSGMTMNTLASSFLYAFSPLISIVPSLPLMSSAQRSRVLSFFSYPRNWDSPTPLAAGECASPPFDPTRGGGGGHSEHSLAGEGLGESQCRRRDIHCGALYLQVLCGHQGLGWPCLFFTSSINQLIMMLRWPISFNFYQGRIWPWSGWGVEKGIIVLYIWPWW